MADKQEKPKTEQAEPERERDDPAHRDAGQAYVDEQKQKAEEKDG